MTPEQQKVLALITQLDQGEFENWFDPADVMGFVQIESNFKERAYRYEPHLATASWGLMQVLQSTAAALGLHGTPAQLYDPLVGLRYGMRAARADWTSLSVGLKRAPTKMEWAASYNEGPGNVLKGRSDHAYVMTWLAARNYWAMALKGPAPGDPA